MPQIKIRFSKDGTSVVETEGFVGADCTRASDFVEKALGMQTHDEKKQEYFSDSEVHQHLRMDGSEDN